MEIKQLTIRKRNRLFHRTNIAAVLVLLILLPLALAACVPAGAYPTLAHLPSTTPTGSPLARQLTPVRIPTVTAHVELPSDQTRSSPVLPDEVGLPTAGTPGAGEVIPDLLHALLNDLAERLGIPVDQITVVHSHAVEWSDGSLGCPQPGKVYIQVLTPGFRVVLAAQDLLYDYHTDKKAQFILCNPDGVITDPPPLLPILPGNKSPKCKWPDCN